MSNFEWQSQAACAEVGPDPFFVPKGGSNKLAKEICSRCIVRPECLENVLQIKTKHDEFGVVAGMSPRERAKIRKARKI